ncbi:hypothetical protein ACH6EH_06785 [Paenibacillus sp. JSM ZJ436]|uniref:hypothetical protein n=1 Tax=Paenibacillus sp. JSM ZJ436 TaxID=3376190 RepID=UPI0037B16B48
MKNTTNMKIPAKYQPMLDEVTRDSDGYWAYSNKGYMFDEMGCHTASEDTQAALMAVIRSLVPCDCKECVTS